MKKDMDFDKLERNIMILQAMVTMWLVGLGVFAMYLLLKYIGVLEQEALKECISNGYSLEYCRSLLY